MGGDDKSLKEKIADDAAGVAVEVYKDAAKPALQEVGNTLGSIARLLLRPIKAIADGGNKIVDRLSARLQRGIETIPPERRLPPPANVVGPAVLQYALLGEGDEVEELRELFAKLLLASMDSETAKDAHPAFVNMISQLTPDEAWLLKAIPSTANEFAIIEIREWSDSRYTEYTLRGMMAMLGVGIGIDESRQAQYLSNLDRLGILHIDWSARTSNDDKTYAVLEERMRATRTDLQLDRTVAHGGLITITPLGKQFLHTCVGIPHREAGLVRDDGTGGAFLGYGGSFNPDALFAFLEAKGDGEVELLEIAAEHGWKPSDIRQGIVDLAAAGVISLIALNSEVVTYRLPKPAPDASSAK